MRYFGSSFAFSFQSYRTAVLAVSKADEKIGRVINLGARAFVTELGIREFIPRIGQRRRRKRRGASDDYLWFAVDQLARGRTGWRELRDLRSPIGQGDWTFHIDDRLGGGFLFRFLRFVFRFRLVDLRLRLPL